MKVQRLLNQQNSICTLLLPDRFLSIICLQIIFLVYNDISQFFYIYKVLAVVFNMIINHHNLMHTCMNRQHACRSDEATKQYRPRDILFGNLFRFQIKHQRSSATITNFSLVLILETIPPMF